MKKTKTFPITYNYKHDQVIGTGILNDDGTLTMKITDPEFDKPKVHEPEFTKNQAADDMRKAREEGQRWGLNNLLTAHVVNPYMLKYHNDPSATNYNIQLAHIYENGIQEGRRLRRSEMKREFEQKN